MKRREAKGLTAGLAMLGLVCAPAGAAAQTFEQPTLAPPVMAPPPVVIPGAPSAPPIAGSSGSPYEAPVVAGAPADPMAMLSRDDRKFIEDIQQRVDKLIEEITEARAGVAAILKGPNILQMSVDAHARRCSQ